MLKTKLIVMSLIVAMAFCLPGAAESRGDHHWKWKKHRFSGWPFRALLNNLQELENRLSALEAAPTIQADPGTTAGSQIYFLATVASDPPRVPGPNEPFVFDAELHDDGSNYDHMTGAFEASESGVYRFDATVFYDSTSTTNTTALLRLRINGGNSFDLQREPVITGGDPWDSVSGGLTLRLDPGDTVEILYLGPTARRTSLGMLGGTHFTGHQLYSSAP